MNYTLVDGIVTEWKPGYARVKLPTYDDIVTDWLQIVKPRAMHDDVNWALEVDELVMCLVDCHCRDGVILGSVSNEVDVPDADAAANMLRVKFQDGTFYSYDKAAHKAIFDITDAGGEIDIKLATDTTIAVKDKFIELKAKDSVIQGTDTKITLLCDSSGELYCEVGGSKLSIKDTVIEINGGSLGGLIKIADLVSKLNALESDLNTLKTAVTGWVPIPNDGGAALKAASAGWAAATLTPTVQSSIEDAKVKH